MLPRSWIAILSNYTLISFFLPGIVRQDRPPSPDGQPTVPSSASGSAEIVMPVLEKSTIEEEKELPMELPEAFRFQMGGKMLPRPNIRHVAFAK